MIRPSRIFGQGEWRKTVIYASGAAICHLDWLVDDDTMVIEVEEVFMFLLASSYDLQTAYDKKLASLASDLRGELSTEFSSIFSDVAGNLTEESRRICESSANRNALGLLIQPIENGTRYVRVGRFETEAKHGGVLSFVQVPFRMWE
jgi:hypothetical protein